METYIDYLQDALNIVSAWELPEEAVAQAINDQARLMAGMNLEISSDQPYCSPYAELNF